MPVTERNLVKAYMNRLDAELADLPQARRREIAEEIAEHIEEAGATTEAEERNVLDRLGDPAVIAEEARTRFGLTRPTSGALEVAALLLVAIGGVLLPVVGALAGLVLVWASRVWVTREKLLATLMVLASLFAAWLILADTSLSLLFVVPIMILVGLATAAYLGRQLSRGSGS